MAFYDSIVDYYDLIFPLSTAQVDFVKGAVGPSGRILDVGCGTGSLALALSGSGFSVIGIDSDMSMLLKADAKATSERHVDFTQMDMSEIFFFNSSFFDAVLCFGNTLVHLDGPADMEDFFQQVRTVLKDSGAFLLQILNYDHILDHSVEELPLIETDLIRFDRFYRLLPENGKIAFRTVLTVKEDGRKIENEILLSPIRRQALEEALRRSGFTEISFYGDFGKGELKAESLPLVVEAR